MDKAKKNRLFPLHQKLLIMIGLASMVIVTSIIFYNNYVTHEQAMERAKDNASAAAIAYGNEIKLEFEKALDAAHNLAQVYSSVKDVDHPVELSRLDANTMVKHLLEDNESFAGIMTVWEPNAFDGLDLHYDTIMDIDSLYIPYREANDSFGHFVPYWFRDNDVLIVEPTYAYGKDWYEPVRTTLEEQIIDPTEYNVNGEQVMFITMEAPIQSMGVFYGVVGVDFSINWLQERVNEAQLYEGTAEICILANNGEIAALSGQDTMIGKDMEIAFLNSDRQREYLKNGEKGQVLTEDFLHVYVPILLGRSEVPWQVSVIIPTDIITADADQQVTRSILITAGLMGLASILMFLYVSQQVRPLRDMNAYTMQLALGDFRKPNLPDRNDELGQMKNALNRLVSALRKTRDFAKEIGEQNLDAEYTVLSDKDELGFALIEMRDNLRKVAETEENRRWIADGQNYFSDLLRHGKGNLDELSYTIIKSLIKYVDANQGGIFIEDSITDPKKPLKLAAAFAWDREKRLTMRLAPGETLTGQCFQEGKRIFITDLPKDYLHITSGIGKALPRCLLVVPLKVNDEILGVLELASFKVFTPEEVGFIEAVAENIASALQTTRNYQTTQRLLEQTRQHREELMAQEEELRQNQEELQATHEELDRVARELRKDNERLKNELKKLEQGQ